MNYELSASTFAPTAKVDLQRGEKLRIEPGAMVYQLGDIELEGHMNTNGKKGLGQCWRRCRKTYPKIRSQLFEQIT